MIACPAGSYGGVDNRMRDGLAKLWRARLAVTAGLLAISTAAVIKGHHDAWAGDHFYKASLVSDLFFVLCGAFAYYAAWIGAFFPAYFLCLNFVFCYRAVLNVGTLIRGEFVLVGSHGCAACNDGARRLILDFPDYFYAGLLATIASKLAVARLGTRQLPRAELRAHLAMAIFLLVAWFAENFYLNALKQISYVVAQLYRIAPYATAALLATIATAYVFEHSDIGEAPPPHLPARVIAGIMLVPAAILVDLFGLSFW